MKTFVLLFIWTPQGLKNVKQSPSRLDAARKAFEPAGMKIKDFYLLMGQFDCLAILEAPNEEVLARAVLTITAQGDITTQTCRAFAESEYRELVGQLP